MRAADQTGVEEIRLRRLDLADRGREIGDVERVVFLADHLAAFLLGDGVVPDADVARCVVIGADVEAFLAEILERPFEQRHRLLVAAGVDRDRVLLAQAALIDRTVDEGHLVAAQHRAGRLARGARDGALQHHHLVVEGRLLGILRELLDVRLTVISLQVNLLAEQTTGGVDLLDRELHAHMRGHAERVERAGQVVQRADRHGVAGNRDRAARHGHGDGGTARGGTEELPA